MAFVQGILLTLIGACLLYTIFAHLFTWYYFVRYDRRHPSREYHPPVSIIKPTKGVDQSAFDNFRSFCEQEYAGEYELLFCVEEPADPSVPVIERVIASYPERNVRLIFSDPADRNSFGKLKNMMAGLAESTHEVIIFSDSDAHVPPTFLTDTVACMHDPTIGLGFSVPAYEGADDWPAALTSLYVNAFVLRVVPLCLFGLFQGAVGTTMVVRRAVIDQIGGLEQFGWHVTDDMPLAQTIHALGYKIHLLKEPARVFHHHDSFKAWWSHAHRWLVIIRHYLPVPFWLMNLMDLALWWGILYLFVALALDSNVAIAVAALVLVVSASLLSAALVNINLVRDAKLWRFLWVAPLRDILWLPLLIDSCVRRQIVWRGRRFHVNSDCTLTSVDPRIATYDSTGL